LIVCLLSVYFKKKLLFSSFKFFKGSNEIEQILTPEEERKLVTFVEKIDWDFPNINKASEKGF
jgi:hypothetical protein